MMRFLHNIAGIAGFECVVLLAMAATVLALAGHGMSVDAVEFASGNF